MFSVRDAYRTGWRYFKENTGFLVGIHFVALCVELAPQILLVLLGHSPETRGFGAIAGTLLSFVVALGLVRIGLGLIDGELVSYSELFASAHLVFNYLIASILYALIVLFGILVFPGVIWAAQFSQWPYLMVEHKIIFLFLVFPGVIWAAQFSQWPYLMVEHEMGPIEALKESARITKGTKGQLILFLIVSVILILLGFVVLIVGAVVAYAVITMAGAYVYRQILANQPEVGEGAV
jgi:uncharacterized membrane protein